MLYMENKKSLLGKLTAYNESESYPFHMPGHKRKIELGITSFPNPFSVDITEIDGFDNLHQPKGLLKESMKRAASVYGADHTYYLVNGSSCGILSAICGTVRNGGRIIMARNSHKSAYHACVLNQLDPFYIWPEYVPEFGIQGGMQPDAVERAIREHEGASAVFITSPTYEGVVSDVEAIAEIVHKYKIPLIVDEAHGAHFSFGGESGSSFPKSALDCGADIVIQSLHKTLPSLTQTAALHIKGTMIESEKIERYLQMFESSSPSYVLLSSIENCIFYMAGEGRRRMADYGMCLKRWMKLNDRLKCLKLLTDSIVGSFGITARDPSKILVSVQDADITGMELSDILRNEFHLESEMCCSQYVLLMTSLMDTEEGFCRLFNALAQIDRNLVKKRMDVETQKVKRYPEEGSADKESFLTWMSSPKRCMELAQAENSPSELAALSDASGRISASFITLYPPGTPALVPGEVITEEFIKWITYHLKQGYTVEGILEENREELKRKTRDEIQGETKDEIEDETKDETKDKIKDETKDEIKDETKDEIKDETKDVIKDKIKDETKDEIKDETKDEIKDKTKDGIEDETKDKTKDEIEDETKDKTKEKTKDEIKNEWKDRWNFECKKVNKEEYKREFIDAQIIQRIRVIVE